MYNIGLGRSGNSRNTIDKDGIDAGDSLKVEYVGSTLDCGNFIKFWISWENYNIKVGLGDVVNSETIMEWQDTGMEVDVNFVALSSYANSWTLRSSQAKRL